MPSYFPSDIHRHRPSDLPSDRPSHARGSRRRPRPRAIGALRPIVWTLLLLPTLLAACSSSGGSSSADLGPTVIVNGRVTYDHVPHFAGGASLQYSATTEDPVRGARVEIVDAGDGTTVYGWTLTEPSGAYAVEAPQNRSIIVRVLARYHSSQRGSWDYRVVDNTQAQALYGMDSDPIDIVEDAVTVNLHASSGWGGSSYSEPRAAAPFAILDTIYEAHDQLLIYWPDASLPLLRINWSVLNSPVDGDLTLGEIRSTFFSANQIYVLGLEDVDTDEYDEHVIAHEFGHFVERNISRSDSIGGSHSPGSRLDPRVAWSEGWANAFSAMVLEDPIYRDAIGQSQGFGGQLDFEDNALTNRGWWSSGSIAAILYDLFDTESDGLDTTGIGLPPILELLEFELLAEEAPLTIFAFLAAAIHRFPVVSLPLSNLAEQQLIDMEMIDAYATGETHSPSLVDALPVFVPTSVNAPAVTVCSDDAYGTFNRLGNRRFVVFDITATALYRFTATGVDGTDPDLALLRGGTVATSTSTVNGEESFVFVLSPGTYVLVVYDHRNTTDTPAGEVCFDVTVTN